jgi:hypothetical protein
MLVRERGYNISHLCHRSIFEAVEEEKKLKREWQDNINAVSVFVKVELEAGLEVGDN